MKKKSLQQHKPANVRRAEVSRELARNVGGELGLGLNSLEEILNHVPDRVKKVFLARTQDRSQRVKDLEKKLINLGVDFQEASLQQLSELSGTTEHQGAVTQLTERVFPVLDQLLQRLKLKERSTLVLLDGVQDPHNFGAIARVAECFAVDALLWPKHRSCGITPTVSKTSAGAIHLIECLPLSNLVEGIKRIKEAGFWIVGANNAAPAQELSKFEFPQHCVLLLGSEGQGIQALAQRELDFQVCIPMPGRISSLNVAQATAVILAAATNSRDS